MRLRRFVSICIIICTQTADYRQCPPLLLLICLLLLLLLLGSLLPWLLPSLLHIYHLIVVLQGFGHKHTVIQTLVQTLGSNRDRYLTTKQLIWRDCMSIEIRIHFRPGIVLTVVWMCGQDVEATWHQHTNTYGHPQNINNFRMFLFCREIEKNKKGIRGYRCT
jgi:hypothetical protein